MDDFLHNLRSGKLKQPDRTRRDYNTDYNKASQQQQQQQRRSGHDRRRTDYYAKVTHDHFMMIKNSLDTLVENQKRVTDALIVRNKALSRMATALDAIVAMVGHQWGYEDLIPPPATEETETFMAAAASSEPSSAVSASPEAPDLVEADVAEADLMDADLAADDLMEEDLDDADSDEESSSDMVVDIISAMRAAGDSWKKIADHFDAQKIPTLSGRGKWTGPAIKKLWEAGVSDTDTDTDD